MKTQSLNDELLIRACSGGNTEAFTVLVRKYQSYVCAITFRATGNVDKSEELAQEIFVLIWQNLSQLKDYTKFKSWLYTITKNKIRKFYRDQKSDPINRAASLNTAGDIPDPCTPVDIAISKEQQDFVHDALSQLPQDYGEPLVLFYREGRSVKQVASYFDLSESTAKKRISRARQMLRHRLTATFEQTLEKTRPSDNFATGVVGFLATSGAISKTASAATTATTAQSSGNFITSLLQSTTAKICTAAAVAVVGTGAALFITSNPDNPIPPRPIITMLPEHFDRGLVLYLSFDTVMGGQSIVIDESRAGNDGILTGGKFVKGRIGKALKCTAKNKTDGLIVKDNDSLDLDAITIAAWIKTKRSDPRWGRILDKGWRDAYDLCIGGDYNNRPTQRDLVSFETAQHCIYSKNRIVDGKWHFITATYDGNVSSIYIDGQLEVRDILKKPIPMKHTDTDIHIGSLATTEPPPDDTAFYDGLIDEVRLYNRVLSEEEIHTLYCYQPD